MRFSFKGVWDVGYKKVPNMTEIDFLIFDFFQLEMLNKLIKLYK